MQRVRLLLTTPPGLEGAAAAEARRLGLVDAARLSPMTIGGTGDVATMYRLCLWARIPYRVLMHVADIEYDTPTALAQRTGEIDWTHYIPPTSSFAVEVVGAGMKHVHSRQYAGQKIKDAIVDQQRRRFDNRRSNIDRYRPTVRVHAFFSGSRVALSLDASGESLHLRNYRETPSSSLALAPLKENVAAGVLDMAKWWSYIADRPTVLVDPFCGTGTIALEAAMILADCAPSLMRDRFGFQAWPTFDAALWRQMVDEARQRKFEGLQRAKGGGERIFAGDAEGTVLRLAEGSARRLGLLPLIRFSKRSIEDVTRPSTPSDKGVIVTNPPYGIRIMAKATKVMPHRRLQNFIFDDIEPTLKDLYIVTGRTFREQFHGWTAYVLTGNRAITRFIGLKPDGMLHVSSGGIALSLMRYKLPPPGTPPVIIPNSNASLPAWTDDDPPEPAAPA